MPTYVSLLKWTDEGARTAKETLARAERSIEAAQKLGGKVIEVYWTQGEYDLVSVAEFPDEGTAQAFVFQIAAAGTVRSETLRAFSGEDMRRIVRKFG